MAPKGIDGQQVAQLMEGAGQKAQRDQAVLVQIEEDGPQQNRPGAYLHPFPPERGHWVSI